MNSRQILAVLLLLMVSACAGAPVQPVATASAPAQNSRLMIEAADAAREAGRFAEASELYQYVLIADPKSAAAQFGVAECLYGSGRASEARRIYTALHALPEYRARAAQGLGLVELGQNHREQAAQALREAVAADPTLWRAYNGLALLADLSQRPDEAAEFYAKALEAAPESPVLYNNRGYSRLLAGKVDPAIADFRKALSLEPGSETILNNLRIAVAARGDYREATRGVPRDKMPVVMNNVGYMAMKRGDFAAAEAYLARAMTESASYAPVTAQNLDRLAALKGGDK